MKRTINTFNLLVVLLALIGISGCKRDVVLEIQGREKYANLYIPQAYYNPNYINVYVKENEQTFSFNVYLGGADDPKSDIMVTLDFKPEMAAAFNTEKGTSYPVMPPGSYAFDSKEAAVIKAGQPSSSTITVKLKTQGYINAFTPYLLPVTITGVSDGTAQHPKLSTAYFLVTGSYEPGHVPAEKVLQLEGGNLRSIFKYYKNLVTHSEAGDIRLYPYNDVEDKFSSSGVISTGWNTYDLVVPYLDRWIVRWGPWTGGNNGYLNSYPVSPEGNISPVVAGWFNSGFQAFDLIVPYQGNFLCRFPAGEIRRYPFSSSYVFSAGVSLGTGWQNFTQIVPYKNTLLCIDAAGNMWEYPVTADGVVSPRRQVGSGWDLYRKVIPFGDDLLGVDENNAVFRYKFNPVGFWALK
jgi:hypothetical protein